MATIQEILTTDSPSSSLGKFNTNFENLNTDKIEASSTNTLTNKTINADNNTISNLEVDNLKTSAKTGLDTKLVTGTTGANTELAMWNTDGDLVSSSKTVSTTAPSSTSTDDTIPTSQAVYNAVNNMNGGSKELFVYPTINTAGATANPFTASLGEIAIAEINSATGVYFTFRTPTDFNIISKCVVVMIPDATETIQWDVSSRYASLGQANNTHGQSVSNATQAVTLNQITEVDVSDVLTSLSAGDYVGIEFQSDTTLLRIIGLYFKYE